MPLSFKSRTCQDTVPKYCIVTVCWKQQNKQNIFILELDAQSEHFFYNNLTFALAVYHYEIVACLSLLELSFFLSHAHF